MFRPSRLPLPAAPKHAFAILPVFSAQRSVHPVENECVEAEITVEVSAREIIHERLQQLRNSSCRVMPPRSPNYRYTCKTASRLLNS